jgi:hypothetical protein
MTEFIQKGSIVAISLVFFIGTSLLELGEDEQIQIKAQDQPEFLSLSSNNMTAGKNGTEIGTNDNTSEDKMQIQICDESHPC